MCSDGMLEDPDIEEGTTLRNIFSQLGGDDANKVKILTDVTEKNKDNHTAFIIHILEVTDPIQSFLKEEATTDRKFASIVEDDLFQIPENREQRPEATQGSMPEHTSAPTETNRPKKTTSSKKPLLTNIVRFAVCLVTVALLTCAILWFRSCNADKDQEGKEQTEQPSQTVTEEEETQHPASRQESAKSPDADTSAATPVATSSENPQQTPAPTAQNTEETMVQPEKKPLIQSVTDALGKKTKEEENSVEEKVPTEDQQTATPKKEKSENEETENILEPESV